MNHATNALPAWTQLIDLASARMGGKALKCSDDFFASMGNLLRPEPAVFIPGKFTDRGKWMDGWESRRKRVAGHDWCIVQLGQPGEISGVNVDTAHFNGNQPEFCTIEGAEMATSPKKGASSSLAKAKWTEAIPRMPLRPGSPHFIEASPDALGRRFSHIRLNIFPDGGVARLRVYGEPLPDWPALERSRAPLEMSAAKYGGLVVAANDMHFGSRHNLIMPDRAKDMGDGWETRRKRGLTWSDDRPQEHDWAVVRLARRSIIQSIDVDTNHFKGNFPESCAVESCDLGERAGDAEFDASGKGIEWRPLLERTPLLASSLHKFDRQLSKAVAAMPATHVRLRIFPDGGVSRLRVWGRPAS